MGRSFLKVGRGTAANACMEALEARALLSSTWMVSSAADDGSPGTLRSAIQNSQPGDVIAFNASTFAPTSAHTILLNGSLIPLTHDLTIVGPGAQILTLSGNSASPVFQVTSAATVLISGLGISNGKGGAGDGGAISNQGALTLNGDEFVGNASISGGAIYNLGSLLASTCVFTNNSASGSGSAIFNQGQATLRDCTLNANVGSFAVWNVGTLVASGSTFSGDLGGVVTPNSSGSIDGNGSATVINSTFTANTETAVSSYGRLLLTNCTIVGNSSSSAGGVFAGTVDSSAVVLNNTIVTGNFAGSLRSDISGGVSGRYNLIGNGGSGGLVNGVGGNIVGVRNSGVAPLGSYGGPTQTMPLLAFSPALDAGSVALAVDEKGNPLGTDQRGLSREFGSGIDIGAYEAQPPQLPGDVNHDGTVNLVDFLALTRNFGTATPKYEMGDLNGDGTVDLSDLLLLVRHFGASASKTGVGTATATPASSAPPPMAFSITRAPKTTRRA